MLAQKHDIAAYVPRLKRAPLKITKIGFNRSFDDMTIIEATYLFYSWVTFALAIWVCRVFVIRFRIYEI